MLIKYLTTSTFLFRFDLSPPCLVFLQFQTFY